MSFTVAIGTGANGLTAMVPTAGVGGATLTGISLAGSPVSFTRTTIKGVEYAMFQAAPGTYTATYGTAATAALSASAVQTTSTSATLMLATTSSTTTQVSYGTSATSLTRQAVNAEQGAQRQVTLTGLRPGTTYYYRVKATGPTASSTTSAVRSFTTPALDTTAPAISAPTVYPLPDGTAAASWRTNETSDGVLLIGRSPQSLSTYYGDLSDATHTVVATKLQPGSTYYYRLQSTDRAGNTRLSPPAAAPAARFVTPAAGVADHTWVGFRTGTSGPGVTITRDGLGGVTLASGTYRGQFTSRVLDSQQMVTWDRLTYGSDLPAGAQLRFSVRTGSTPTPDRTWTAWTSVQQGGRVNGSSRYIQYRVQLVAGTHGNAPLLRGVGITDNGQPLTPGPED